MIVGVFFERLTPSHQRRPILGVKDDLAVQDAGAPTLVETEAAMQASLLLRLEGLRQGENGASPCRGGLASPLS